MIDNEQLERLKDYLIGSCNTIQEAMETLFELDEDDLTDEEIENLDQDIFKCAECGWWCEISEESGIDESDLICNDCAED